MEDNCGIIILAAGSSFRMGTPKQALLYKDTTLLKYSIATALASIAQKVVVVLGAGAESLQPGIDIHDKKLAVIVNNQWQEGMAASIRCGLNGLLTEIPALQSALFMVCDQPFVSADLLNKLVTLQKEEGHAIVASKYAETTGIPAIFDKKLFNDLLQLKGDAGAKKIMMQQPDAVAAIAFPLGGIDIDTAADYNKLKKM